MPTALRDAGGFATRVATSGPAGRVPAQGASLGDPGMATRTR